MGSLKHNYYTLQSTQSPPHVGDELCTHYYHTLHGQGAHTGHTPRGAIVARRVHCAVEQAQRSAREGGSLAHERPHHTRPARRPHARRGWRIEVAHAACFCTLSLNSHSHSHHVDHVRLRLPTNGWGWGGGRGRLPSPVLRARTRRPGRAVASLRWLLVTKASRENIAHISAFQRANVLEYFAGEDGGANEKCAAG